MKLSKLYDIKSDVKITGISINSKTTKPGDIFVCTMGVTTDRHDFIDEAIENGASAVLVSKEVKKLPVPVITVENTNEEMPLLAQRLFRYPEKKLKIIAVTGTDGKTSSATIIKTLIGKKAAIIGTNGYEFQDFKGTLANTTPDADKLFWIFYEFLKRGAEYVVMEVSSEAIFRNRVDLLTFSAALHTNITKDHLNIHKTFENYLFCKSEVFRKTAGPAVLNIDDNYYEDLLKVSAHPFSYGFQESDLEILDWNHNHDLTTSITFKYNEEIKELKSPLIGKFNVYNLMGSILLLLKMGFDYEDLTQKVSDIFISGRVDFINENQDFTVIVDYAHTVNGVKSFFQLINSLNFNKVYTVIGQAGGRDSSKRKDVGKEVLKNSDLAIFTEEDSRQEDPIRIAEEMASLAEGEKYLIIPHREEAIHKALSLAKKGDLVAILGKGAEDTLIRKEGAIHFNDEECVRSFLSK